MFILPQDLSIVFNLKSKRVRSICCLSECPAMLYIFITFKLSCHTYDSLKVFLNVLWVNFPPRVRNLHEKPLHSLESCSTSPHWHPSAASNPKQKYSTAMYMIFLQVTKWERRRERQREIIG